jgi:cell filamentation protein
MRICQRVSSVSGLRPCAAAAIDTARPFREGNGRTQCVFIYEVAVKAGCKLDFSVVSARRLADARLAAREQADNTLLRALFVEISHPQRVAALRGAIESMNQHGFKWDEHDLGSVEPGRAIEVTMAGIGGSHFMARTKSDILIGKTADLPTPHPARGEIVTFQPTPWGPTRERGGR